METASWTVGKLVDQIASKEILMPEARGGRVWTPEKARALIDSVYRGYPSGSVLLWEADPQTRDAGGRGNGGAYLLLDGQQRLASLYAVITGAPARTRRNNAVRESKIEVFFNMDHADRTGDPDAGEQDSGREAFRLKSPAVAGSSRWIDVTRLFREGQSAVLSEKTGPDDPNYQKYLDRLNALRGRLATYFYPVQILDRSVPYAGAADVFVRVNSQGAKMRRSDLALAQITSRWSGSAELFAGLSEECGEKGYDLDGEFLVRCLMSVATGKSGLNDVGGTPINRIQRSWEKTRASLLFVIGFLKNAGVENANIPPAKFPIMPMVCIAARYGCRFPASVEGAITEWLRAALARGRYSGGSAEAALDEDLRMARNCDRPVERMAEICARSGRPGVAGEDLA